MSRARAAELGFSVAMAACAGYALYSMAVGGFYQTVWFAQFYQPHAYAVLVWVGGYFAGMRSRFGPRAPLAWGSAYASSEVVYNTLYPAYSALLRGFIIESPYWLVILCVAAVAAALCWRLLGARLGRPERWWGWAVTATYWGGYVLGYGLLGYEPPTLSYGNFYSPLIAAENIVGNAEYVAVFLAWARPAQKKLK